MQYQRIHIAPHDSVFDGWFVVGTRTSGGPVTLGTVSSIEEAESIAAFHRVALTIDDQVRRQIQAHAHVQAAWRTARPPSAAIVGSRSII